jgi:hypothetical protein
MCPQAGVDCREAAPAQPDDAHVGFNVADQRRTRSTLGEPDGWCGAQKYVAKEASSRTKSLRLLNWS